MLRGSLLLQISHVAWSMVCMSVCVCVCLLFCWAYQSTVQKWLNQSRCGLWCRLVCAQENITLRSRSTCIGRGTFKDDDRIFLHAAKQHFDLPLMCRFPNHWLQITLYRVIIITIGISNIRISRGGGDSSMLLDLAWAVQLLMFRLCRRQLVTRTWWRSAVTFLESLVTSSLVTQDLGAFQLTTSDVFYLCFCGVDSVGPEVNIARESKHRHIKYSLDFLRPIRTAEAFEAVIG